MTVNNIGVTIINKALFANIHFPYPYMLTVVHMFINYLACHYIFTTLPPQQQQQQQTMSHTTNIPPSSTTSSNSHGTSSSSNNSSENGKTNTNMWIQLLGDDLLSTPSSLSSSTKSSSSSSSSSMLVIMILYSMLFSMNIAIGNVSLQHVSINFNQVMRSLVPIITLYCTYLMHVCHSSRPNHHHHHSDHDDDDEKPKPTAPPLISFQRQMAVYMVVFGVMVSTVGDRMSYTIVGLVYTLLCVVLAALKVVVSSELLTTTRYPQFKMHPLRLLHRMAPLAFVQCLVMSVITGEFKIIRQRWYIDFDPFTTGDIMPMLVLIMSGILAFSLNICALQAYKVTSPITCCIAAAVKQVLMVWIGTAMFHTPITPLNGFGILIVLVSSTYYSYLSITEPKERSNTAPGISDDQQHLDDTEADEDDDAHDDTIELGVPLVRRPAPLSASSDNESR